MKSDEKQKFLRLLYIWFELNGTVHSDKIFCDWRVVLVEFSPCSSNSRNRGNTSRPSVGIPNRRMLQSSFSVESIKYLSMISEHDHLLTQQRSISLSGRVWSLSGDSWSCVSTSVDTMDTVCCVRCRSCDRCTWGRRCEDTAASLKSWIYTYRWNISRAPL